MEIFFDQEEYVVVDVGTGYIKAGFSGEDYPRVIIPTVMGEKVIEIDDNLQVGSEQKTKKLHTFGNQAFKSWEDYQLFQPVQRGIVQDMETDHL